MHFYSLILRLFVYNCWSNFPLQLMLEKDSLEYVICWSGKTIPTCFNLYIIATTASLMTIFCALTWNGRTIFYFTQRVLFDFCIIYLESKTFLASWWSKIFGWKFTDFTTCSNLTSTNNEFVLKRVLRAQNFAKAFHDTSNYRKSSSYEFQIHEYKNYSL